MKITIDDNKKVSKQCLTLAERVVKRMMESNDDCDVSNAGNVRCVCHKAKDGFNLFFHKSILFGYVVFATGKATK